MQLYICLEGAGAVRLRVAEEAVPRGPRRPWQQGIIIIIILIIIIIIIIIISSSCNSSSSSSSSSRSIIT